MLFSQKFKPRIVLNVGISGRIKDAKVGDVVVPSQLNIVDVRSTVQDSKNGGYEMLPGGRMSSVSPSAAMVLRLSSFKGDNKMLSLEEFSSLEHFVPSQDQADKIVRWQQAGSLASRPSVIAGSLASGSMVVKSDNFKKDVLQQIDRNYIAFDMESGGVADSLRALADPPEFFAVRAISDPADHRKAEFDAIGGGLFRRWAVKNATITLKSLLQSPVLYGERNLATDLFNERVEGDYLENYPGQMLQPGSVEEFDARFCNLCLHDDHDPFTKVSFSQFITSLTERPPGSRILVQGHGGAGKSAMLRKAWNTLHDSSRCQAVFLNARNTLIDASTSGSRGALMRRISRDAPGFREERKPLFVFVDELYGLTDEQVLMEELEQLLEEFSPTYVFGFGVDHYDRAALAGSESQDPYIYNLEFADTYDLKTVALEDERTALSIIEGIISTGYPISTRRPVTILAALRKLGFLYINHFVVSLYLNNIEKMNYNKVSSSTQFVLKAMETLYGDIYGHKDQREGFRNICVEALRAHCRELTRRPTSKSRQNILEKYEVTFAHFPKVVQTSLIAQAVVHLLSKYSVDNSTFEDVEIPKESFLSLVFANDVNSSIKDLMSVPDVEQKVLATAARIFNKLDPMGLSYALYLFGRAKTVQGRREAKKIFAEARDFENVGAFEDNRYMKLARRSLHISAAMMDDHETTSAYIRLVLSDPVEDMLNRSFHLEYYGDHKGTAITVELELDDLGGSWRHTRSILRRRIDSTLSDGITKDYDRISILTYFTLVRYRLEQGKLDTRIAERDYLDQVLSANLELGIELSSFLTGLRHQLDFDRFTTVDALVELLRLKSIPRGGWVKRGMGTSGVEAVGAHVMGAMLLADLLMGYALPSSSIEDHVRVQQLLLYHDIGENYIGDYDPTDGAAKAKELPALHRIGALSLFHGLGAAAKAPGLFISFEGGTDHLALLARDFDKLDAVFQAFIYASQFPSIENRREFFRDHLNQIQSLRLKEIAQEVTRRADALAISGP